LIAAAAGLVLTGFCVVFLRVEDCLAEFHAGNLLQVPTIQDSGSLIRRAAPQARKASH